MSIVESCWLDDPARLAAKLDSFAAGALFPARTVRFGQGYRGRDLVALQAGAGKLQVVLVAGLHAAEYPGPYGMLAFAYTLGTGRGLDGEDLTQWVNDLLAQQTTTIVPLLNLDGAIRMSEVLPGC